MDEIVQSHSTRELPLKDPFIEKEEVKLPDKFYESEETVREEAIEDK